MVKNGSLLPIGWGWGGWAGGVQQIFSFYVSKIFHYNLVHEIEYSNFSTISFYQRSSCYNTGIWI